MRAGCSLQWDLLKAQRDQDGETKRNGTAVDIHEKERLVLEKFRERAGPSLRQLTVRSLSTLDFSLGSD